MIDVFSSSLMFKKKLFTILVCPNYDDLRLYLRGTQVPCWQGQIIERNPQIPPSSWIFGRSSFQHRAFGVFIQSFSFRKSSSQALSLSIVVLPHLYNSHLDQTHILGHRCLREGHASFPMKFTLVSSFLETNPSQKIIRSLPPGSL